MEPKTLKSLTVIAAILGGSLLLGLTVLGFEIASSREMNAITVTGSVKKRVTADLAKWTAGFTRRANLNDLKATMEEAKSDADKVKKFVMSFGIEETSIHFQPLQTSAVNESSSDKYYSAQTVIGYDLRQELTVENSDIAKIETLALDSKKLIDQGIVPEYQNTEYFYTKIDELRPELFAQATEDAQKRAKAIAGVTGVRVGKIKSAKTGLIQIMQPNSMEITDYGAFDTSTKEKEITATVTVSFDLK